MKQRVTDTPEAVLKFAPKDRPSDDNDPTDQSGRAVVALLQQAASQSNDTCERAMSLAHKLSVQLRAAEDQINQLRGQLEFFQNRATRAEAEAAHFRDRTTRAEDWLLRIHNEVEQAFFQKKEREPRQASPQRSFYAQPQAKDASDPMIENDRAGRRR